MKKIYATAPHNQNSLKSEKKRKSLKAARRRKKTYYIQRHKVKNDSVFLVENNASKKRVKQHLYSAQRKKPFQPRNLYIAKISFKTEGEINFCRHVKVKRIHYQQKTFNTRNVKGSPLRRRK